MAGSTTARIFVLADTADATAKLDDLAVKSRVVGDELGNAGKKGAKDFSTAVENGANKTGGVLSGLSSKMSGLGVAGSSSLDKFGQSLGNAETKGKQLGGVLSEIGKVTLAGGLAAFAAAAYEGVKGAMALQKQMEMIHTQAGASQGEVTKMTKSILGMAAGVATGPQELAASLFHVESTGMRGAQALKALNIAAEGAKVGNANLVDVQNALDAAIVSGIPGVQNLKQAMGSLNAVVGSGDMTMQDMADAMSTGILGTAKTMGLSLKDVGAALAVFGDNNIRGAAAATRLRQAIVMMAAPSAAASGALAAIGMQQTQLAQDMRSGGLVKALTDLQQHLKASGASATEQGIILSRAFGGGRTSSGILLLMQEMDRLKSKYVAISAGSKNFGSDWKATTQTLSFEFDQLKAGAQAFADRLGAALIPKLQEAGRYVANHRTQFEDLAKVIGVMLAGAVLKFAYDSVASFVAGTAKMTTSVLQWTQATFTSTRAIDEATTSVGTTTELAATQVADSSDVIRNAWATVEQATATITEQMRVDMTEIGGYSDTMAVQMEAAGAQCDAALQSIGVNLAEVNAEAAAQLGGVDASLSTMTTGFEASGAAIDATATGMGAAFSGMAASAATAFSSIAAGIAGLMTKFAPLLAAYVALKVTMANQNPGGTPSDPTGVMSHSGPAGGSAAQILQENQYVGKAPKTVHTQSQMLAWLKSQNQLIGTNKAQSQALAAQIGAYSGLNTSGWAGAIPPSLGIVGGAPGHTLASQFGAAGSTPAAKAAAAKAAAAAVAASGGVASAGGGGASAGATAAAPLTGALATYLQSQSGQTALARQTLALQKLGMEPAALAQQSSNLATWAPKQVGEKEIGGLQRAGMVTTGLVGQAAGIQRLRGALSPQNEATAAGMAGAFNASNNPALVNMAQKIETSWDALTLKLANIVSADTQRGQSEMSTLSSAAISTNMTTLRADTTAAFKTRMDTLVTDLRQINKGMATQVVAEYAAVQNELKAMEAVKETTAQADKKTLDTATAAANTTATADAAKATVQIAQANAQLQSDAIMAAAQSITDASRVVSDAAAAQVTAVTDSTQALTDAANAQATQISDQATTKSDILGERGKWGLDLVAQQAKVALDIQTQTDHVNEAAATAHLDAVTTQQHQIVAAAQQALDISTQQTDANVASAQQAADTASISSAISIAAAQAKSDAVSIVVATNNAAAQATVDSVQWGTALQQQQAQAAEKMVSAQGAAAQQTANASLQAATNTANSITTSAQTAYQLAQATAQQQQAAMQAAYNQASSSANLSIAAAQQNVAAVNATAQVREAQLNSIYQIDQAMAATQFAGGGVTVNILSNSNDPQSMGLAAADALGWFMRTNIA